MKKQCLYLAFAIILLTACNSDKHADYLSQSRPLTPDNTYSTDNTSDSSEHNEPDTIPHSDIEDTLPAAADIIATDFDENGCFREYDTLIAPTSVSGIEYVGKSIDRYIFAFPDNETEALSLYNQYGTLLLRDGFILEEYEGNYIIKDNHESIAFMGTGHNEDYNYIMMMAFYPDRE